MLEIFLSKFVAPKCTPKCAPDAIIQRSCSFYKLLQVSTQQSASSRFDETNAPSSFNGAKQSWWCDASLPPYFSNC